MNVMTYTDARGERAGGFRSVIADELADIARIEVISRYRWHDVLLAGYGRVSRCGVRVDARRQRSCWRRGLRRDTG